MKKQLTILMVTNNYKPYAGGVVNSIDATTQELRRLGHRVIIVTLDFLGSATHELDVERIACWFRFPYHGNRMALPWRTQHQMEMIFTRYSPDIVHVHHPFLLGKVAVRVARKHQIPVVFTYHTLYENYVHYVPAPKFLTTPVIRTLVQKFCLQTNAVIVPSKSVLSVIEHASCHTYRVIPSGILPSMLPPINSMQVEAKPLYKKLSQTVQLVSVSRFMPEKNITTLFDALVLLEAAHVDYHFTLIGYGAQEQFLRDYAYNRCNLPSRRVIFIIKPDKQTLCAAYKQAQLFLFASQTETQGLVLAESMAWGTPVIALQGPGVVDCVQSGKNGFIVDSAQAMAIKIQEIVQDSLLYQNLQNGALETAQEYYPEKTVARLCELYRSVAHVQATGQQ